MNSSAVRRQLITMVEALPDAAAVPMAEVHLSLEVAGKRFGWFMEDHHGDGRLQLNSKAPPGYAASLVEEDPVSCHIPKYVGKKGWAGIWLDGLDVPWERIEEAIGIAYAMVAPKGRRGAGKG